MTTTKQPGWIVCLSDNINSKDSFAVICKKDVQSPLIRYQEKEPGQLSLS
jgi:hypothetical protein